MENTIWKQKTASLGYGSIQSQFGIEPKSDDHTALTFDNAHYQTAAIYTKSLNFQQTNGQGTFAVYTFPGEKPGMVAYIPSDYANTGLGGFTFATFVDEMPDTDEVLEWAEYCSERLIPSMFAAHGNRISGVELDLSISPELLQGIPELAIPAVKITAQLVKLHFGVEVDVDFLSVKRVDEERREVSIDVPLFPHTGTNTFTEYELDGTLYVIAIVPSSLFGVVMTCKEVLPNEDNNKIREAMIIRFRPDPDDEVCDEDLW